MKTINSLSKAEVILNGEIIETIPVKNPCQLWNNIDSWFGKHGESAEIKVYLEDGALFKDIILKKNKNGKLVKSNSVKTTNRGYMKKHAAEKAATEKEETTEETLIEEALDAAASVK